MLDLSIACSGAENTLHEHSSICINVHCYMCDMINGRWLISELVIAGETTCYSGYFIADEGLTEIS